MQLTSQVVVVGGGPAGREAARHAARRGADVVLVTGSLDSRNRLAIAAVRFLALEAPRAAQAWEPEGPAPGPDYAPAMRETLIGALDMAAANFDSQIADLRAIGVRVIEGRGRIAAPDIVSAAQRDGRTVYLHCCGIILATGAQAFFGRESPRVLAPASMPALTEIPESLIVLGSSPAALELACFFAAYGVFVTVVGAGRPALDFLDGELRDRVVDRAAENQIRIFTEATAVSGTTDGRVDLLLSDNSHIDADCALPCGEGNYRTEGLGLEGPGVRVGLDGEVLADEHMRTNIPEIFAAGAITGRHIPNIAIKQARIAAENALGGESAINYGLIPISVWFDPQVGAVGLTEEDGEKAGIAVSKTVLCADTAPEAQQWVKLVADESTGRILGLHAVGSGAVEAVHMGALAMHCGATINDLAELVCTDGAMAGCVSTAALRGRHPLPERLRPLVTGPDS